MNPEQQRIAIAEACGLEPIPEGYYHPDNPIGQTMPDYLNDLNAMHEAEASLFGGNDWYAAKYETLLTRMTGSWAWHATAAQRAEAFLLTIGKWEEGK